MLDEIDKTKENLDWFLIVFSVQVLSSSIIFMTYLCQYCTYKETMKKQKVLFTIDLCVWLMLLVATMAELICVVYTFIGKYQIQHYDNEYAWSYIGLYLSAVENGVSIIFDIWGLFRYGRFSCFKSEGEKKELKHRD